MGIYKQGILGPFSGRVGNVVGTFWKGRCVMRIRAASYNDANTTAQQEQRLKWRLVTSFVKAHSQFIRLGFGASDQSLTPFNCAVRENLKTGIKGNFPEIALDPTNVVLSQGNLAPVGEALATAEGEDVNLTWNSDSNNENSFIDDKVYVSLINEENGEVQLFPAIATRGDNGVSLSTGHTTGTFHVNLFLVKTGLEIVSNRDQVSNAQYLGTVALG